MTRVYLIRHAESVANTQGFYQGQTYNTPLSPLGRKQAQALKKRFVKEKFAAVYASPLKRTIQTAQFLGEVVLDPNLIETNHGEWEGLHKDEIAIRWPNLYVDWFTRPTTVQFPQGEHFLQTVNRVTKWLNKISHKSGTYAAITHSNVIMILLTKIMGLDINNMWQFAMQPTAVTLIESHSPAKLIYINDTSHLNELKSDLSIQAI